ncbi:heat shock 70 kDa protein 12A-like isoform X2 [Mercenaria mercenaria]|uniref:heat shock 70 kDa protein 12A-like isoform X2 n=1 Tax=Mercenaria mercenaria TaxID=6596 RepID=UPI00234F07D1|nr:heat shock 70 kDa protein 12A-like isoform X2 [Mercenaria mercenaria]
MNTEKEVMLQDEMGKSLPALTVFSLVIRYLRNDMQSNIKQLEEKSFDFEKDVYFVIIVPALLQESREINLVTEAALAAGIDAKMISVSTDIDAVSIFYQYSASEHNRSSGCSSGLKYLIVKAGAVTTDIMKHEVAQKDELKEVSTVTSCKVGTTLVDEAIEEFLIKIFRKDVFEEFKATKRFDFIGLKDEIEVKKHNFATDTSNVTLKLPVSLMELHREFTGKSIEYQQRKSPSNDFSLISDKLRLNANIFMSFFDKATKQVISYIQSELSNEKFDILLMFGQFTELPVLRTAVESVFPNIRVVCESDIFKGAFIIGNRRRPERITKLAPANIMVAAIDFGTTYSGWAFSFLSDFKSDRTKASARKWHSGSTQTDKTPTCILLRPDGKTIEAFGYDAENRYRDLIDSGEHEKYYYFRRFKMLLNKKLGEKINREITLEDEMGRSLPALDIFALSIRFLKEDVLKAGDNRLIGQIQVQDVHWVLTVPAIWTDGAKQFMREAAIKAGIESRKLTIALEPEAASIYCRHLSIEATFNYTGASVSSFKPGTRYMILDAGGGTIDITVHEVNEDDGVKEVHAACGGSWGGTMVDKEFEAVLLDLVGEDIFQRFKTENMEDYLELWRDFEIKKRAISPSDESPVRMRLPITLIDLFKNEKTCTLNTVINTSKYANDIQLNGDKMKMSAELSKSFFRHSIDNTICYARSTLKDIHVTAILMVGGYSESPMLQQAIRSTFADIEVVVPLEASFSIMKGALIFGHFPRFITKRVLKYTYGIETTTAFVRGKHPESKRVHADTGDMCDKIFDKHVEKSQSVKVGEPQVRKSYIPVYKQQKQLGFSVYASEIPNPEYTDQNCYFVGKMFVDIGDESDLDREVMVALTFSDTEIVVEAKEKKSGKETYAAIDFLG